MPTDVPPGTLGPIDFDMPTSTSLESSVVLPLLSTAVELVTLTLSGPRGSTGALLLKMLAPAGASAYVFLTPSAAPTSLPALEFGLQ